MQVNLTANTDLRSVKEFQQLVIREKDGQVVRLVLPELTEERRKQLVKVV